MKGNEHLCAHAFNDRKRTVIFSRLSREQVKEKFNIKEQSDEPTGSPPPKEKKHARRYNKNKDNGFPYTVIHSPVVLLFC